MQELKNVGLTDQDFETLQKALTSKERVLLHDPIGSKVDSFVQLFGREAVEELKAARTKQLQESREEAESIVLLKAKLIQLKRLVNSENQSAK